jgi:aminocarboxymuconate-semialdehyde decarboxylase
MSDVIDAYTHVLPHEFYETLVEAHPNEQLQTLGAADHLWDTEQRLSDMDEYGIDRQVLTLVRPPIWRGLDEAEARSLVARANDAVAGYAAEHPDRFVPVATVPFPTEASLEELDRCLDDLGMAGVQLFSNVAGRPLDDAAFRPFLERVAAHGVPVWVHPQLHDWYPWLGEYDVDKMLGWPFDTGVALLRLVFGGVLEAIPDLRIVTHHLGGMLPYFAGRVKTMYEARRQYPEAYPVDWPDFSRPIPAYFEQLYGDTAIGGSAAAAACGHAFFGDDRVVFGSDYPMGPDAGRVFLEQAYEVVEAMALSDEGREAALGGNLAGLLDG